MRRLRLFERHSVLLHNARVLASSRFGRRLYTPLFPARPCRDVGGQPLLRRHWLVCRKTKKNETNSRLARNKHTLMNNNTNVLYSLPGTNTRPCSLRFVSVVYFGTHAVPGTSAHLPFAFGTVIRFWYGHFSFLVRSFSSFWLGPNRAIAFLVSIALLVWSTRCSDVPRTAK